jgi:hypothetical protein
LRGIFVWKKRSLVVLEIISPSASACNDMGVL